LNPAAAALDTAPKNEIWEREREKLLVGSSVVRKQSRESKKTKNQKKLIAKTQNMLRNKRCIDLNPVEYHSSFHNPLNPASPGLA
jgi:hypothetical protein